MSTTAQADATSLRDQAGSRTYEVDPFHAISIGAGLRAHVAVGDDCRVVAHASSPAALDRLSVSVRGGCLELTLAGSLLDRLFSLGEHGSIKIEVTAPAIDTAIASGGTDLEIDDMHGDMLTLSASGGATIAAGRLDASRVSLDASGGARLDVSGRCDQLVATASSGGTLDARHLTSDKADVNASSGGNAAVHASDAARADASSGGTVSLSGGAENVARNASSGGTIRYVR